MLFDGHRVVCATPHGRVVGDDHHLAPRYTPDPGDYSRSGDTPIVHTERCQGRELQEGRARVEEAFDPLAHRQLAALSMPPLGLLPPTAPGLGRALAQLVHEHHEAFGDLGESFALRIYEGP